MAALEGLHWLRRMIEFFHFLVWLVIIYAILFGPAKVQWYALASVIIISITWRTWGSCPISDLEFSLNPSGATEKRSRMGTYFMENLGVSVDVWDRFTSSVGLILFAICGSRIVYASDLGCVLK